MTDFKVDGLSVRDCLLLLSASGNREFTERLNPGVPHILGLRVPDLRKLARKIASGDWTAYLQTARSFYMEERMLQGLVLGYVRVDDPDSYLDLVSRFVPLIDSWAICDSFDFAGGQRFVNRYPEKVWTFLERRIATGKEFQVRFGIVQTMKHYIDKGHLMQVLRRLSSVTFEDYYAGMAAAWAFSVCFVKFPDITLDYLKNNDIDRTVFKMTCRKILESNRVPECNLREIRTLLLERMGERGN